MCSCQQVGNMTFRVGHVAHGVFKWHPADQATCRYSGRLPSVSPHCPKDQTWAASSSVPSVIRFSSRLMHLHPEGARLPSHTGMNLKPVLQVIRGDEMSLIRSWWSQITSTGSLTPHHHHRSHLLPPSVPPSAPNHSTDVCLKEEEHADPLPSRYFHLS